MDTKLIEYIIAIAEEKSLSKAAERLYISQPALSQRLKKLEDELGTPLFARERDGLTLTDAGRIYVNGGYSILQIKRNALKKIASLSQSSKNTLRFACASSSAMEIIPAFRKSNPEIELIVRRSNTPSAKEDLIMGRADLGVILTSSLQHSVLEYLPLWTGELLLAVPDGHSTIASEDFSHGDYTALQDDYFVLTRAPSFVRNAENQALRSMQLQPNVICEIEDDVSRRYMLNNGIGNAFVPSRAPHSEDTYHTYSLNPPLTFYVVAAYQKSIILSEPMKQLIRLLLTQYDELP
ncbi:MAG TPA: hypothetical protein DD632_03580 [Oribacterium sp.]|nr:hypothetical protein [Oribacterium sp.]